MRFLKSIIRNLNLPPGALKWSALPVFGLTLMLVGSSWSSLKLLLNFCLVSMFVILQVIKYRPKNIDTDNNGIEQASGLPKRFSHDELQVATNNFTTLIGSGGFGSVFKGVLAQGKNIAVKRLDKIGEGEKGFLEEVKTIGNVNHFNLARLIGFCAENKHKLLVYEYMCNGSLDKWIFKRGDDEIENQGLDWGTRKKVILDIAKGLAYLHEDCWQKIIHLDIKPHNILLDENFSAKVSDFGLSKLIARDENQVRTGMRGTPGYIAPELQQSIVTVKADVYSFGIVLLEIVTGRRNVDRSRSESSFDLLQLLQKKAEEDRVIDVVEDYDEDMENRREEVERMMRIGVWCLQNDYKTRPLMSTVVKALQGDTEVDPNIIYKFRYAGPPSFAANDHIISVAPQESLLSAGR